MKPLSTSLAHHITSTARREGPPHLVAKIKTFDISEEIRSAFINANQSGTSRVFSSQMYSTAITIIRNEPLKHRSELKEQDPIIKEFVRHPATLLIQRARQRKFPQRKTSKGSYHSYFTFF